LKPNDASLSEMTKEDSPTRRGELGSGSATFFAQHKIARHIQKCDKMNLQLEERDPMGNTKGQQTTNQELHCF